MTDRESLTFRIIKSLEEMSIEELEALKPVWVADVNKCGLGNKVGAFCLLAVDLVIKKKREKGGDRSVSKDQAII